MGKTPLDYALENGQRGVAAVLQAAEVESGEWMDVRGVRTMMKTGAVCPDSKVAVTRYLDKQQLEGEQAYMYA